MADSTTGVLRCADRALAGATGPLLLMGLASTTADFSTCLGRVGSLSSGSKLSHYNLVNEWNVDGDFEDFGRQFNLARCFSFWGHDIY